MTQINADKIYGVRVKILYKKQAPLANHDTIPAKAGIHSQDVWIPAFAGMELVGEWSWGIGWGIGLGAGVSPHLPT